jgi:CRISPR-associated protein (TIGR02584 family)
MKDGKFSETLVFVSGSTPQIITKTIYALAHKDPPVWADEIYVITTSLGKRRVEDSLEQNGILKQLVEEFTPPETRLPDLSFLSIKDDGGNKIDDVRTEGENAFTGDAIVSCIRDLSEDPGGRLHCCLAGGRKTMSILLDQPRRTKTSIRRDCDPGPWNILLSQQ